MNEVFVLYSLIYTIITFCFVYKTDLFISAGLTVENLFESYLGREQDNFVMYHIKRTCITKIFHLSIPLGFFTGLSILEAQKYFVMLLGDIIWQLILLGSLSVPVYALFVLIFHYQQEWNTHPVVKKLKLFQNERLTSWKAVRNAINDEYKLLASYEEFNTYTIVYSKNLIRTTTSHRAKTHVLESANHILLKTGKLCVHSKRHFTLMRKR